MNCIFCQIIRRQRPARVYFEDEKVIVFADIFPKAPIHLLVCPKEHYADLQDTPEEVIQELFQRIKKIAVELRIEDNYRLLLNNGPMSGQIVPHIHFHFMSNEPGVKINYIER